MKGSANEAGHGTGNAMILDNFKKYALISRHLPILADRLISGNYQFPLLVLLFVL